ncbi:MAG: hypothetical protein EOP35_01500 [Rubrivivax sp.]|nr:MAG: hypothetical protein EOP35_01500 [Rubrivivax sp.]
MIVDKRLASAFARLGLTGDPDARAVRQAYARQLKQIDQATEIAAFQALREDYELALTAVQRLAAPSRKSDHTCVTTASLPPATDPDLLDSAKLAEATFAELAQELATGIDSPAAASAVLKEALQRLVSLEAGKRFEQRLADLLAQGWQPGHEFLLEAASAAFGWTDDHGHLRALGGSGWLLQEALIEQQAFLDQPEGVLHRQRNLVRRLRDATPPSRTLLRDEQSMVTLLVRRFPNWLGIVTSMENVERWLGGPDALQAARESAQPALPVEAGERRFSDAQVIWLLLWLVFMAWRYFG